MDPFLVVASLARSFRSVEAVAGVDLSVSPGEVVGLLGPNGSGKSTTMKIIAGVVRPSSGSVSVGGHSIQTDALAAKRLTGYVPDVGGLFPRLTGAEHLEVAARLWGLTNWKSRADHLLQTLDIAAAADRRASTYSHGMSRRLSAAIALLPEPPLLLLDEPFDGVDPSGTVALRLLASTAAEGGTAVLLSTHLLDLAERSCSRLYVLRSGTVAASGSPSDIAGSGSLEDAYLKLVSAQ